MAPFTKGKPNLYDETGKRLPKPATPKRQERDVNLSQRMATYRKAKTPAEEDAPVDLLVASPSETTRPPSPESDISPADTAASRMAAYRKAKSPADEAPDDAPVESSSSESPEGAAPIDENAAAIQSLRIQMERLNKKKFRAAAEEEYEEAARLKHEVTALLAKINKLEATPKPSSPQVWLAPIMQIRSQ